MVNFRYHLVSLIAVFLALAIGVVLGAGPLQNSINGFGKDEAAVASVAELQEALVAAQADAEAGSLVADALANEVLPGTLAGQKVALVALPETTTADLDSAAAMLTLAGADVLGPVEVTAEFVSQQSNTYRETLASPVSAHLSKRPADASPSTVLATGLVEVLTQSTTEAELISSMLTDEATPLVTKDSMPGEVADALMLVGPGAGVTGVVTEEAQSGESRGELPPLTREAWISLGIAFGGAELPAVAVGQAAGAEQFIAVLREAGSPLATADRGGSAQGSLNGVLIIAANAGGAFGTQLGATSVLAPLP